MWDVVEASRCILKQLIEWDGGLSEADCTHLVHLPKAVTTTKLSSSWDLWPKPGLEIHLQFTSNTCWMYLWHTTPMLRLTLVDDMCDIVRWMWLNSKCSKNTLCSPENAWVATITISFLDRSIICSLDGDENVYGGKYFKLFECRSILISLLSPLMKPLEIISNLQWYTSNISKFSWFSKTSGFIYHWQNTFCYLKKFQTAHRFEHIVIQILNIW